MTIRFRQKRAVSRDDVFERFHRNHWALCQRPPLEVIAHGKRNIGLDSVPLSLSNFF